MILKRKNSQRLDPKVINQMNGFGKSFKSMTLDTVKSFLADSKKSRFSL